jgi:hypothetical protein
LDYSIISNKFAELKLIINRVMAKENIYLNLESGSGTLYQNSKTEQEGFVKHVNTKNTISYRKYFKMGVFGILRGVSIRPSSIGEQLSLAFEGAGDVMYYVSIPLRDMQQGISTYASAVISYLPYLVEGEPYKFSPWAMERKDNPEKKNYGVSFKYANIETEEYDNSTKINRLSFSYYKDGEIVEGEVPAGIWKKKAGKDFLDTTDRDEFLWNVLEENKFGATTESKATYVHTPAGGQATVAKTATPAPAAKVQGGSAIEKAQGSFEASAKKAAPVAEVETVEEEDDNEELPF